MNRAILLDPRDWVPVAGGVAARIAAPGAGRLVVWVEGAAAAELRRADGTVLDCAVLGGTAFVACDVPAPEALSVVTAAPPARCVALLRGAARAPGPGWPRALAGPQRATAPELAATRARMDGALAALDLDGAIAALADMLLLARHDAATTDAAGALLRHLARHPLLRGAALGPLVAALTEVPA